MAENRDYGTAGYILKESLTVADYSLLPKDGNTVMWEGFLRAEVETLLAVSSSQLTVRRIYRLT